MRNLNRPRQAAIQSLVDAGELALKTVILRRQPKNLVAGIPTLTENKETLLLPRKDQGDKERRTWSPDSFGATGILFLRQRCGGEREIRPIFHNRQVR